MLNKQLVMYYRIVVRRRKERDEYASFAILAHGRPVWIGCTNDGYDTQSIVSPSYARRRFARSSCDIVRMWLPGNRSYPVAAGVNRAFP